MRAHEAGALHAEGYGAPPWLARPDDVNALVPALWPTGVQRGGAGTGGALSVAGLDVGALAAEPRPPPNLLCSVDFGPLDGYFANGGSGFGPFLIVKSVVNTAQ